MASSVLSRVLSRRWHCLDPSQIMRYDVQSMDTLEPGAPGRNPVGKSRLAADSGVGVLDRSMLLCIAISTLLVAYLVVLFTFTPLYLIQVRGFDQRHMSWIMSSFGVAPPRNCSTASKMASTSCRGDAV